MNSTVSISKSDSVRKLHAKKKILAEGEFDKMLKKLK